MELRTENYSGILQFVIICYMIGATKTLHHPAIPLDTGAVSGGHPRHGHLSQIRSLWRTNNGKTIGRFCPNELKFSIERRLWFWCPFVFGFCGSAATMTKLSYPGRAGEEKKNIIKKFVDNFYNSCIRNLFNILFFQLLPKFPTSLLRSYPVIFTWSRENSPCLA